MINPDISFEAHKEADNKEEAWIPVDEYQQIQDNFWDSECIWVAGSCLCLVKELEHSVNPVGLNGNLYGKI